MQPVSIGTHNLVLDSQDNNFFNFGQFSSLHTVGGQLYISNNFVTNVTLPSLTSVALVGTDVYIYVSLLGLCGNCRSDLLDPILAPQGNAYLTTLAMPKLASVNNTIYIVSDDSLTSITGFVATAYGAITYSVGLFPFHFRMFTSFWLCSRVAPVESLMRSRLATTPLPSR